MAPLDVPGPDPVADEAPLDPRVPERVQHHAAELAVPAEADGARRRSERGDDPARNRSASWRSDVRAVKLMRDRSPVRRPALEPDVQVVSVAMWLRSRSIHSGPSRYVTSPPIATRCGITRWSGIGPGSRSGMRPSGGAIGTRACQDARRRRRNHGQRCALAAQCAPAATRPLEQVVPGRAPVEPQPLRAQEIHEGAKVDILIPHFEAIDRGRRRRQRRVGIGEAHAAAVEARRGLRHREPAAVPRRATR